jgi:hypothetical protein
LAFALARGTLPFGTSPFHPPESISRKYLAAERIRRSRTISCRALLYRLTSSKLGQLDVEADVLWSLPSGSVFPRNHVTTVPKMVNRKRFPITLDLSWFTRPRQGSSEALPFATCSTNGLASRIAVRFPCLQAGFRILPRPVADKAYHHGLLDSS